MHDASYDVARLLPHRPPLLLIDRICEVDLAGGQLHAERLLAADDPLGPLWPLLVVEALCQAAACLNGLERLAAGETRQQRGYLVSISGFDFPRPEGRPDGGGERLLLRVRREARLGQMVSFAAEAEVQGLRGTGHLVARGRLLFAVTSA